MYVPLKQKKTLYYTDMFCSLQRLDVCFSLHQRDHGHYNEFVSIRNGYSV